MTKKPLQEEDFYNWWLTKYHNTTVREILKKEPELCKSADWYKKYAVSQEEHDAWYEWAIATVAKHFACPKKIAKKLFGINYLNLSPSVKKPDKG